jgi:hypothetical protein
LWYGAAGEWHRTSLAFYLYLEGPVGLFLTYALPSDDSFYPGGTD